MTETSRNYPDLPNLKHLAEQIALYTQLKHERRADGVEPILARAEDALRTALASLKQLPEDAATDGAEPSGLSEIRALRPAGPRTLWQSFDEEEYGRRLQGALIGRFAGCTLGAPVEFWTIDRMQRLADETGRPFPPVDYWTYIPDPRSLRYEVSPRASYTRDGMDGVPVDDDIIYTLLGLLIAEAYSPDFTTDDVGRAWLQYLPYACTAEEIALRNLKAGVAAAYAAEEDNPYCEWIGGSIRADPWGYLAPGRPERAAEMAHRDAYLSHRRQGIFGEMFFAASIAAGFAVDDPVDALEIGLTEIPRDCAFARSIRWALDVAPEIRTFRDAREAVEDRFRGMHPTHAINNACLTVWGVTIGGTDLTRVIGETVAMGLDNDCTAATAGSLVGAVIGFEAIPPHWYSRFNDTVHTYLVGHERFSIADVQKRFARQAVRVFDQQ